MLTDETDEAEIGENSGSPSWLFLLLVAGTVLVIVGVLLVFAAGIGNGSTSSGIVIFIGPIPIVFGSGPASGLLILIGVIIAAVSLALFVVLRRRMQENPI